MTVEDKRGGPVEEQVGDARLGSGRKRHRSRRPADVVITVAGRGEPAGHARGLERLEHGDAGEAGVERLECACGAHQDRRRARSLSQGVPDQALQPPHPRPLKRVADLRRLLEQQPGPGRCACGQMSMRGGQDSLRPAAFVAGQLGCPGQQGARCRVSAAGPGAAGGAVELCCDGLVRAGRRCGEVPCPAVGVPVGIHFGREHLVGAPAVCRGRPAVYRGPDERMAEPRLGVHHDHPVGLRRPGGGRGASEPGRRSGDQPRVTGRFSGDDQQQVLGAGRQGPDLAQEMRFEPPAERQRPGQQARARQLSRGQLAGELDDRQRAPLRFRHDPPGQLGIERPVHR